GIRIIADQPPISRQSVHSLEILAIDRHPAEVRLALASVLQKLPVDDRWDLASALMAHAEDATDPSLTLMIWYGIEPLPVTDASRTMRLIEACKIPLVRQNLVRRLVQRDDVALAEALPPLVDALAKSPDRATQREVLRGMLEAWHGRHSVPMSMKW